MGVKGAGVFSIDRLLRAAAYDVLCVRDRTGGWKRGRDQFLRAAAGTRASGAAAAADRLGAILTHAYETSPYYRRSWSALGFDPAAGCTAEDLARLPFLTKEIIREHKDEIVSEAFDRARLHVSYTGGTTGTQTAFHLDHDCLVNRVGRQWGILQQCGYRPGMRRALVWGVHADLPAPGLPAGIKQRFRHYADAQQVLCCTVLTNDMLRDYHRKLVDFRPSVLYGYPSALCQLATYIRENDLQPIAVRTILTTAERLGQRQRSFLQETFAGELFNLYCTREYGCIGFECRSHAGFHIDNQSVFIEITRDGRRMPAGEPGEITVTDLMNYGMPFIRSRTGDLGRLSDRDCECGSPLPLLTNLDGRTADSIFRPDGSVVSGLMLADLFIELPCIRFAQFVQEQLEELQVLVEVTGEYTREVELQAVAEVKALVGDGMNVRLIPVESIPRSERSGKFREVICRIGGAEGLSRSAAAFSCGAGGDGRPGAPAVTDQV